MSTAGEIWPERIDGHTRIYPPAFDRDLRAVVPGKVAIVFVSWNAKAIGTRCLRRLILNTNPNDAALILVENGSTERGCRCAILKEYDAWKGEGYLINLDENVYYSQAFNLGMRATPLDTDMIILMSNDCEPKSGRWIKYFTDAMGEHGAAAGLVETNQTNEYHTKVFHDRECCYLDYDLGTRVGQIAANVGSSYQHLYQYCCIMRVAALAKVGLYLQHGRFYQHNSDWEMSMRLTAAGLLPTHVVPDVHHWHAISGLWADHRRKYNRLVKDLEDPAKMGEYLVHGRPIWEAK